MRAGLGAVLLLVLLSRSAVAGPTFVVNSLADVPAGPNVTDGICETATGNGVCTLRAAIMEANAGTDAIVRLPAGFYPLTAGTLNVLAPMKIEGDGPSISVVDGISLARVFRVAHAAVGSRVEIRGLTIQRGSSGTSNEGGGGVLVDSPLLLENVHVKGNAGFIGAGLRVNSSLSMRHCVVEGNQASSSIGVGGGIAVSAIGSATIEDSRIDRNAASQSGAGIFAASGSIVRLDRTLVARNLVGDGTSSTTQTGGGLEFFGTALVLNSLIWGNASSWAGGGLDIGGGSTQLLHVTVTNNSGFASFAANPPGGAINVASGAGLSLTRSIVTSNKSECLGSIFSGDYNVIKSAADCPLFGLLTHNFNGSGWTTLAFNGGFSPDVSTAGTPAEGTVPAASCLDELGAPLATDIRGHRRKPPGCDRGAHDAQASYTPAQLLGVNLVRNGGAQGEELGLAELVANPTNVDLYQAPYWAQTGRMVQIQYGAPDGYPTQADAPLGSGYKFFAGGIDPVTIGRQVIDVSSLAAQIDGGGIQYDASGAFGGYLTDNDRAALVVQFRNDLGLVDLVTLGGFTAADRGNQTGLIFDQRAGAVPVGTRALDVSLVFERAAGNANDGYADDVALVLPEPGLASGLGAALLLLASLAGRRPRAGFATGLERRGRRTRTLGGVGVIAGLASGLVAAVVPLPRSAAAASRSMTGSLAVFSPSSQQKPIDSGPAIAGEAVGPFAPTTGAQIVEVAGSTSGTFVGRTVTLGAGKLDLRGRRFVDFPQFPNAAQTIWTFMSAQNTMTFRNGGGALAACPGNGCTAGGQGTHISWCPPRVVEASRPAPGTPAHKVGNWDCANRLDAGTAAREARIRISNAVGAPHFGGTMNLLRRQINNFWLVAFQPSTPAASDAVVERDWRSLSRPAVPGGENFNYSTQPLQRGPRIRARLNGRGAMEQTFGCTNPAGTVGAGKTYLGLPGPTGPYEPIIGFGQNCGTPAPTTPPIRRWGFRMTTGTLSGSAFFPFARNTTALGTPFAPVIGTVPFGQGFFFTRMGGDTVDGSVRNIGLIGGGIAVDTRSGFDFFEVTDLRMKLTVPEPAGAADLFVAMVALVATAARSRGRRRARARSETD